MAFEMLHSIKRIPRDMKGRIAIKLDLCKPYNRVKWEFLEYMLTALGLIQRWMDIIMNYVKLVSYSLLVNGVKVQSFWPYRGLRQGDPLSPYLFIICAKGLTSLLKEAKSNSLLKGLVVVRNNLRVFHMFFVDDNFVFLVLSKESCEGLK